MTDLAEAAPSNESQPISFPDRQIGDFLAATASTEPSPGAGSNAALALALGLACARKAVAITLKHEDGNSGLAALGTYLEGVSAQAIAGGEADGRCFAAYIEARRLPHDDAARLAAERETLENLVAVGEGLIAIGDEARQRLLESKAIIHPSMINDIAAALALIAAARSIHAACTAESARSLAALSP